MEEPKRDEPEAAADELDDDLELEPDTTEDVMGGLGGNPLPPTGPGGHG
jgi:hypothetical protein